MLCIKAIYIAAFAVWEQPFKLPFKASLFNKKIQFWHSTQGDRTYSTVVTWVALVSERIKSQHTVKEAKVLPKKTQLLMQLNPLCFKCCWRKMIIRVLEPKANIVKHVAKNPLNLSRISYCFSQSIKQEILKKRDSLEVGKLMLFGTLSVLLTPNTNVLNWLRKTTRKNGKRTIYSLSGFSSLGRSVSAKSKV